MEKILSAFKIICPFHAIMVNEQTKTLIISWIRKRYMGALDDDLIKVEGIINSEIKNILIWILSEISC
jgi:hypothetical protein